MPSPFSTLCNKGSCFLGCCMKKKMVGADAKLERAVLKLIAHEQHLTPAAVTLDSTFAQLGIDSLAGVNLLFAFEEEFKIEVPDSVVKNVTTVQEVVEGLKRLLEHGAQSAPMTKAG
jgi:acyl carrier protein